MRKVAEHGKATKEALGMVVLCVGVMANVVRVDKDALKDALSLMMKCVLTRAW